jgi:hypothetical protein
LKNTKNILLVSAPRSGSTYVSERLQEWNSIDINLFEDFSIACNHFSTSYTQKAKLYDAFCKKWSSKSCIAKINLPNDWTNNLGNTWLMESLQHSDVYYLTRNRTEHILDIIASKYELNIADDWEEKPVDIYIKSKEEIVRVNNTLKYVHTLFNQMKGFNRGIDITLEDIKQKDTGGHGIPKRTYNFINQVDQYDHMDARQTVDHIINNFNL